MTFVNDKFSLEPILLKEVNRLHSDHWNGVQSHAYFSQFYNMPSKISKFEICVIVWKRRVFQKHLAEITDTFVCVLLCLIALIGQSMTCSQMAHKSIFIYKAAFLRTNQQNESFIIKLFEYFCDLKILNEFIIFSPKT